MKHFNFRLPVINVSPVLVHSELLLSTHVRQGTFQHDLQQIDWETILTPIAGNPFAMAGTLQEIFESLLNVHAPIKRRRVRSEFAPWLTPNLRKSIDARDRHKKIAVKSPEIWSVHTRQRNRVTKEIRYSVRDYYKGHTSIRSEIYCCSNRYLNAPIMLLSRPHKMFVTSQRQ